MPEYIKPEYFLDMDGDTTGPLSIEEVAALHRSGRITDRTLYATAGATQWFPVAYLRFSFPTSAPKEQEAENPSLEPKKASSKRTIIAICVVTSMVVTLAFIRENQNLLDAVKGLFQTAVAYALLAGVGAVYFIPSIVGRRKRNSGAIFVLNLLLGWTVLGWIIALVWACTVDPDKKKNRMASNGKQVVGMGGPLMAIGCLVMLILYLVTQWPLKVLISMFVGFVLFCIILDSIVKPKR